MSVIQVKFNDTLVQSEIRIPLTYSSKDEAQEFYSNNQSELQQTLIYGIQAPLIMVNNIVVNFPDVISFELNCDKVTPSVHMTIQDRYQLTTTLDSPGIDNELRVQILPKFEDKYKKINLTFYITQMRNNNGIIYLTGEYKSAKFISDNIKSFGQVSIYELVQSIAKDSNLGFASNVENSHVVKYTYCDNKNYKELLKNEVAMACSDTNIYDYWVDWWNNIVLVDIYERYNSTDSDEDMLIWIAGQNQEVSEGSEIEPIKVIATLHNNPTQKNTELYVSDYKICTSPGQQMHGGTDRVFSIYEDDKSEYLDYLIQDGDSKKDIFVKYEYLGEAYKDHNYLLGQKKYETFKQKITSNETIEVTLNTPLLGIMRGNKVNFIWYINNGMVSNIHSVLKDAGCETEYPETSISLNEDPNIEENYQDGYFEIDKTVSGQYLVTKCSMRYKDNSWQYIVTLSRPSIMKPNLINE